MKERPIPFSAPMVRAILDNRKCMTRRVVKSFKHFVPSLGVEMDCIKDVDGLPARLDIAPPDWECCPYGQPGDRLWVREAWKAHSTFNELPPRDIPAGTRIFYLADSGYSPTFARYRHARFMPRWASRILLEITGVRVERVQDISEADALAEGVSTEGPFVRHHFLDVWNSINAKRGFGWDANPWTWVIEFKRIEASR